MLRHLCSLVLAAVSFGVVTTELMAQGAATSPRIAYINSETIIQQAPGRAAMEAQFEREMTPVRDRLKAINDSNAAVLTKYEADAPGLSPEARAARERQIGELQRRWQVQVDSLNRLAAARGNELEAPLAALLQKVLADIRAEEGYWMIFDVASEGGLAIVAIDRNMDISERVLARLRAAASAVPPVTGAAPPPGGPVSAPPGVGIKIPPPPL